MNRLREIIRSMKQPGMYQQSWSTEVLPQPEQPGTAPTMEGRTDDVSKGGLESFANNLDLQDMPDMTETLPQQRNPEGGGMDMSGFGKFQDALARRRQRKSLLGEGGTSHGFGQ